MECPERCLFIYLIGHKSGSDIFLVWQPPDEYFHYIILCLAWILLLLTPIYHILPDGQLSGGMLRTQQRCIKNPLDKCPDERSGLELVTTSRRKQVRAIEEGQTVWKPILVRSSLIQIKPVAYTCDPLLTRKRV